MFKNYFKIAWRNVMKSKTFSGINVLGLAIGIAAFLMIVNYLRFEYSFDDFHVNKDRIYRVPMVVTETGGKPQKFAFTYPALAPAMKADFPEVQEAIRFRKRWGVVQHGDQRIIEDGMIYYVDPAVFKVFSFGFEKGTPSTALVELNDAAITHSTAVKYFGTADVIGKTLHYDNEDFVVKAILNDVPANSHINFHILLNYNKYIQVTKGDANTSWGWSDFYTYLLLKPGVNVGALQAKMPAFAQKYMGDLMKKNGFANAFLLEPLKDIHAKSDYDYEFPGNGNLYYLRYLGIAAILILLIALINYVNLSTARSLERSKEVGVRKVIGATKIQLVKQFISETFLLNALGIIIGFCLFRLALPGFAKLIGHDVIDLQISGWLFWAGTFVIFVCSTLIAGFYPAFVLSSFQPAQTLKSVAGFTGIKAGRNYLRKFLVIVQFATAIILIGGAIGFYRQLQFMSNKSLGINIDQTLVLKQTVGLDSVKRSSVEGVINDLQNIPGVEYVTVSSNVPGNEVGGSSGFTLLNSKNDKRCRTFAIDENFVPHFGLTMIAGRNFDKDRPVSNDSTQIVNIIINETAAKIFGFKKPADAINQLVSSGGTNCKIIGVMNDYHQESLQYNFDPVVYYPEHRYNMDNFCLKLKTNNLTRVVDQAKKTWSAAFPESPLQYFFLDEYFNRQYKNDQLFSAILWWFTLLAIVIASLGLLGLSLYTVAKRTKEIGVRKVLGATVWQIITLITKDYIKLVLLAGIIAVPAAYFLLQNWLNDYAFHINIGILFFLLPLLLIAVIALVTVLFQSVKAAMSNPVKSLRTE